MDHSILGLGGHLHAFSLQAGVLFQQLASWMHALDTMINPAAHLRDTMINPMVHLQDTMINPR